MLEEIKLRTDWARRMKNLTLVAYTGIGGLLLFVGYRPAMREQEMLVARLMMQERSIEDFGFLFWFVFEHPSFVHGPLDAVW